MKPRGIALMLVAAMFVAGCSKDKPDVLKGAELCGQYFNDKFRGQFKDPDSVQLKAASEPKPVSEFDKEWLRPSPEAKWNYEFQVNAKNSFGGYTGYEHWQCFTSEDDTRVVDMFNHKQRVDSVIAEKVASETAEKKNPSNKPDANQPSVKLCEKYFTDRVKGLFPAPQNATLPFGGAGPYTPPPSYKESHKLPSNATQAYRFSVKIENAYGNQTGYKSWSCFLDTQGRSVVFDVLTD